MVEEVRTALELPGGIPDFGWRPWPRALHMGGPRIPSQNLWQVPRAIAYNLHLTLKINKEKAMKKVKFETTLGSFTVELDEEKAPLTCENFLKYVKEGFYDGTVFHRVIKGFMIQGGGLTKDFNEKETHAPIKNEASNGLKNEKFTIAMARTPDPHSATAQFFINTVDNAYLDFRSETRDGWGYCVFGKVIEGTDTVEKIEKVKTGSMSYYMRDVPTETVEIISARVAD